MSDPFSARFPGTCATCPLERYPTAATATVTDHLEAARDRLGGLHDHLSRREVALAADDLHAILSAILNHLEAQQTEPEPDPLDESNHTDRIDRRGLLWIWCNECDGLRIDGHDAHKSGIGWSAFWIDKVRGPLTFAPR